MNFTELNEYVNKKYGLKFLPAVPDSDDLYVLATTKNSPYFGLSR